MRNYDDLFISLSILKIFKSLIYIYIRNCFWRLWYSQQKSVKIITPLKFTSNMVMRDDAMSIFAHAIFIPQVKIEGQPTPMD